MFVKIITMSLVSSKLNETVTLIEAECESKIIEWSNSSDRKWLVSHQHWALNNMHCILIRPVF
jgi:hypothetical protein